MTWRAAVTAVLVLSGLASSAAQTSAPTPDQQQARDIFRELVEINTSRAGARPAARVVADRPGRGFSCR